MTMGRLVDRAGVLGFAKTLGESFQSPVRPESPFVSAESEVGEATLDKVFRGDAAGVVRVGADFRELRERMALGKLFLVQIDRK